MTWWDKAKGFVFGGGALFVFVLLMGFIDWRVSVKVQEALAAQDIGTDTKIIAMDKVSAENTRTGSENAEDIQENKNNVAQAFRVLMGDNSSSQ